MNDWSLEDLFRAGEVVEDLAAHPGWKVIDELLQAEVDTVDRRLDTDRPLDSRAEYAAAHGRRGGSARGARGGRHGAGPVSLDARGAAA
jgi:hypothetical protein